MSADRGDALPWSLEIAVTFDGGSGSETRRVDLERAVASALREAACFRSVEVSREGEPEDADLRLAIVLDGLEDEQLHDLSLASRHTSGNPEAEQSYVARLSARVRLSIETVAGGATVRSKRFTQAAEHRPLLDEDPRAEAARKFTDDVVHSALRFACKGSQKTWTREIDEARERRASAR